MLLLNKYFESRFSAGVTLRPADFTLTDDGYTLSERQREYFAKHGMPMDRVVCCRQVHGDGILVIEKMTDIPGAVVEGDALVTTVRGLAIGVRTADCLPVFIADPEHGVIAVVHAGWRSTYKKIVPKTLEVMHKRFGTSPASVRIVLGPAISAGCYPVGEEFRNYFPERTYAEGDGWRFDVVAENQAQLEASGVPSAQITSLGMCSFTDEKCHSFRRDGDASGRMLSFMWINE
jgi:YfiH family protein